MITKQRYDELLPRYAEFTAAAEAYKQLLQAHDLPFSIDFPTLRFVYKTQLFTKLVGVDKGLKMRYDMLKSGEAKATLVDATIDLTGYDLVDELINGLQLLNQTLNAANMSIRNTDNIAKPTLADMVGADTAKMVGGELNAANYLSRFVIDWTADRSTVLDMIHQYAELLTSLETMLRGTGIKSDSVTDAHRRLADLVNLNDGTATVNELAVYNMLEAAKFRKQSADLQARKESAVRELNREQNEVNAAAARKRAAETEAFLRSRSQK